MADMAMLEHLHTDIEVAPPSEYADSSTPNLLPEGTYDFLLKAVEPILDRDNPEIFKGFRLQCEVVGGPYDGRGVAGLSVWAATYLRNGARVSQLGDFIRALDATAEWSTPGDAGKILLMAIDRKMPFRVKIGWEAFDNSKFENEGGPSLTRKSPEEKALRKACTTRGMRNFKQAPDGSYIPEVEGSVEGEILEGRLSINSFIASHKRR
jgi:hypothetical protein